MFCEKCGKQIEEGKVLCEECEAEEQQEEVEVVEAEEQQEEVEVVKAEEQQPKKGGLVKASSLLGTFSILCSVVAVAAWLLGVVVSLASSICLGLNLEEVVGVFALISMAIGGLQGFASSIAGTLALVALVLGIIATVKKQGKGALIKAIIAFIIPIVLGIVFLIGSFIVGFVGGILAALLQEVTR